MSALDRIAQLRAEGDAAVAAAADSAALEEVRIAYLGRKAELPQLLRGVAALPVEQRSAVRRSPR
jgi:phenylalanyl-tRNA synthetase alpha chain